MDGDMEGRCARCRCMAVSCGHGACDSNDEHILVTSYCHAHSHESSPAQSIYIYRLMISIVSYRYVHRGHKLFLYCLYGYAQHSIEKSVLLLLFLTKNDLSIADFICFS